MDLAISWADKPHPPPPPPPPPVAPRLVEVIYNLCKTIQYVYTMHKWHMTLKLNYKHTQIHTHTHTHTYVDRHSKWGQHSEDTLKWWFAKLSEDKSLPLLFTSVCSPAYPSLNFRGAHASCTLIAIDGAFKFLDRIHPEFSRTFQIVTTLLKKKIKKNITNEFLFCTFKARVVLYMGMCGLVPSSVSLVKKRSETSSLCQQSSLRRCLTTDRSSVYMPSRTHTHTHTHTHTSSTLHHVPPYTVN